MAVAAVVVVVVVVVVVAAVVSPLMQAPFRRLGVPDTSSDIFRRLGVPDASSNVFYRYFVGRRVFSPFHHSASTSSVYF